MKNRKDQKKWIGPWFRFASLILALMVSMAACQPKGESKTASETEIEQEEVGNEVQEQEMQGPEEVAVAFILRELFPNIGSKDMKLDDRKYAYAAYDLNGSGAEEIILVIPTMQYCGSGGCRIWVLSNAGEQLSTTSVADYPIAISLRKTNGWHDLITWSDRSNRALKYDGSAYDSNASMAEKVTEDQRKELTLEEVLVDAHLSDLRF